MQSVIELEEGQVQTENGTNDSEVQATDYELITTKQQLNVLEFEKALQTEALLKVDASMKRFYCDMTRI